MIVVSDTSPLNYLVLIRAMRCFRHIFKQVHIPPAVLQELHHSKTPELVRQWAAAPPPWLRIEKPQSQFLPSGLLDAGEMRASALARELGATALLIDERRGRKVAQENGFAAFGTLTILELAAEGNLIQLRPALDALKLNNFSCQQGIDPRRARTECCSKERLRPRAPFADRGNMVSAAQSNLISASLIPAQVDNNISYAVLAKANDAERQAGESDVELLDAANGSAPGPGDPLVAKATGLGSLLDVSA